MSNTTNMITNLRNAMTANVARVKAAVGTKDMPAALDEGSKIRAELVAAIADETKRAVKTFVPAARCTCNPETGLCARCDLEISDEHTVEAERQDWIATFTLA